jgi:alpha-ketoglutarate-dependent taurine dioxygenase
MQPDHAELNPAANRTAADTLALEQDVSSRMAWRGDQLPADAGIVTLSDEVLEELTALVEQLRASPLPLLVLRPEDFKLPKTESLMVGVREELRSGLGFALLDKLPVDAWSHDEAKAIYWLLGSMIARPVAQNWQGAMIYDVTDKGRPPGNGVRPDVTNVHQNYHTDNSYNITAPHFLGLLCLRTAMQGGVSGIISFYTAHNEMRRRHPDLVARLYQPFHFDRQREHAPGDVMTTYHPMLAYDGEALRARLSHRQVMCGYALAGVEIDTQGRQALEAFEAILEDDRLSRDFHFEPGQMQFLNNLTMGHRRTGFTDWPEPGRKRHLVRLWMRDEGARSYLG